MPASAITVHRPDEGADSEEITELVATPGRNSMSRLIPEPPRSDGVTEAVPGSDGIEGPHVLEASDPVMQIANGEQHLGNEGRGCVLQGLHRGIGGPLPEAPQRPVMMTKCLEERFGLGQRRLPALETD